MSRSELRLRKHQQENLDFFRTKARAMSLLPYGSGKTAPVILRIGDLIPPGRALIVTTTGTIYKWLEELKKWGHPNWVCVPLIGKRPKRIRMFAEAHSVAVINYEGLRVMLSALGARFSKAYRVIIFDELHRVKQFDARVAEDAATMAHPNNCDYVYGLTGSPVLESPRDLFPILRVINPFIFGDDQEAWLKRYFTKESEVLADGTKSYPKLVCKSGAMDFLADKLHSISFRRDRDQVQVDYPKQIFAPPIVVELYGRTRQLYENAEKKLVLTLKHQSIGLPAIYPRLEKLCQLSRSWCYDDQKAPIYFAERPALDAFTGYMEDVRGQGQVAVWAIRPPDMVMMSHVLRRMNVSHRIIYGGSKNLKVRADVVSSFNHGNVDCLIANPRCIGEGNDLNANYSFRYSYRWSAMEWEQPIGRFARISSTTDWVHYTNLIVRDTLDEGIVQAISAKLNVAEMIRRTRSLPWRVGVGGGIFDDVTAF